MAQETQSSEGRGVLTDAERAALAGERTDSYRYKTRSYLKRRIEKVERDAEVLAEHAPELLDELQDAVDVEVDRDASDDGEDTENAGDGDRRGEHPTPGNDDSDSGVIGDEGDGDRNAPGDDPLDSVGFPEHVDHGEAVDAVRAAVEAIETDGPLSKGEVVAAIMPEHTLGYDVDGAIEAVETSGERYRGAWWRKVVQPGLSAIDGVEYQNGVGWRSVEGDA